MSTESNKTKTPGSGKRLEQTSVFFDLLVKSLGLIAAVLSLITTIFAGIGANLFAALFQEGGLPTIPSEYVLLSAVILAIAIGLSIVFYVAFRLYRQQAKQRQLLLEQLREREKDFFQGMDIDLNILLQGEA